MRRLTAAILIGVMTAACGPPPLTHSHDSADALARAVIAGVTNGDQPALADLALSEREFRDHVWPSLPAARPERNLPFSYVWGDLRQKSDTSLARIMAEHRGRSYDLVRTRFAGAVDDYAGFRVHREAVFVIRGVGGAEHEVRLCGSFLEQNGQWKVFSYLVDE